MTGHMTEHVIIRFMSLQEYQNFVLITIFISTSFGIERFGVENKSSFPPTLGLHL